MIRAQSSKTVLKIWYKSSLVYLKIKNSATGRFELKRLANRSNSLSSNLVRGKKSKITMEKHFLQKQLWL